MNAWLKQFIPPILIRVIKYKLNEGWHGNFESWNDAKKRTTGYEASTIIDRVRVAALKAKNREVAYEQSARTYDKPSVNLPILAALLYVAMQHNNQLVVLDYGGSLGSLYYQLKPYLKGLSSIKWCIVEQPIFVEVGQKEFADDELHFFYSVQECLEIYEPQLCIFASSLQYLEKPYEVMENFFQYDIPNIILDRIAFIDEKKDRLTIQKVPPAYYEASYPCWFLSKSKFLSFMSTHYSLIAEFKNEVYLQLGLQHLRYEGMWFEKK
jgi:putative methyltransferase (TIGR04325 family)